MREEPNGSWAPINDAINGWISVDTKHTCSVYDIVDGKPFEWGVTGTGNEDIICHIMCCKAGDSGVGSQEGASSNEGLVGQ